MKKEAYHDYAIRAFALYARELQSASGHIQQGLPLALAQDLTAVKKTLDTLEAIGESIVARCVEQVYCSSCGSAKATADAAAQQWGLSVTTVFRYLHRGRYLFARFRGLNTD